MDIAYHACHTENVALELVMLWAQPVLNGNLGQPDRCSFVHGIPLIDADLGIGQILRKWRYARRIPRSH